LSYHRDSEVNQAIIRLMDALCTWERETSRGSTLLIVPDNNDEKIVFALHGKPIPDDPFIMKSLLDGVNTRILPNLGDIET